MVVEELQMVTRPERAPPAWSSCTLRGRHRELAIFGVSQRPAHVDKNFFANATWIRTGRLNCEDDQRCLANVLAVPRPVIAGLVGHQWIARDMLTGALAGDYEQLIERNKTASARQGVHGRGSIGGVRARAARGL
jgi:hypothetical protein